MASGEGNRMENMRNPFDMSGRVAIITGGATGLGLGMTKALIGFGCRVVMMGRREEVLKKVAEELGPLADYFRLDVTDTEGIKNAVSYVRDKYGRIDVLINDAGIQFKSRAEDAGIDEFRKTLDVHLTGAFAMTQACLPTMEKQGKGSVIFISSMAGHMGLTYLAAYSAAKAGVTGLVMNLASEVSHTGVRFNAIVPGWIESPMLLASMGKDVPRQQKILGRTPLGKFGDPMDIGWAALFLASDASSFITGQSIVVDGGALIGF